MKGISGGNESNWPVASAHFTTRPPAKPSFLTKRTDQGHASVIFWTYSSSTSLSPSATTRKSSLIDDGVRTAPFSPNDFPCRIQPTGPISPEAKRKPATVISTRARNSFCSCVSLLRTSFAAERTGFYDLNYTALHKSFMPEFFPHNPTQSETGLDPVCLIIQSLASQELISSLDVLARPIVPHIPFRIITLSARASVS